ncbi:Very-long-chain enoyl-CoA reductase [Cryptotrichosporon argae]
MVQLTVSTSGKPTISLDFSGKHPKEVSVREVKAAVQAKFPKFESNRQRLTISTAGAKPAALTDEGKTLADYGVGEGAQLRLKDLGKQLPYQYLYLWEYAGPIVLNPLALYLSQYLWGPYEPSTLQLTVRNLTVAHFVKRELESLFVHQFSRPSIALSYIVRNCAYYWGITGLLIGLTLYRPAYGAVALKDSILNSPNWVYGWTAFIVVNELLNLNTHLHQRSIRTPPGTPRKYPTGFGFGSIVCANYFFETLAVFGLVAVTGGDLGTVVYFSIATYFMQLWAGQKYRRYKKEFDPKVFPGKRWKMVPFIY